MQPGDKFKLKYDIFGYKKGTRVKFTYLITNDIGRFQTEEGYISYLKLEYVEPLDIVKVGHSHRRTSIFV